MPHKSYNYTATFNIFRTQADLKSFLSNIRLEKYSLLFINYSLTDFLKLTDENLQELGVEKLGDRIRILKQIERVHQEEWKRTSLPNLKALNIPLR